MANIGIEINIDVTKIDKTRLFQGKKGTYLTLTGFVNIDEKDQYDNNGFITQKKNKDEPKDMKMPILGNTKVFWSDSQQPQQQQQAPQQQPNNMANMASDFDNDSIPF